MIPIVDTVTAVRVLRAEGTVWRYTITTDEPRVYRDLSAILAGEILEAHGFQWDTVDRALLRARVEGADCP